MSWGSPEFVLAIIAISTLGWLVSSWIRARHGYPVENEWSGISHKGDPGDAQHLQRLADENEALKAKVATMEERVAVLERIATDPAERTSREIEALRASGN